MPQNIRAIGPRSQVSAPFGSRNLGHPSREIPPPAGECAGVRDDARVAMDDQDVVRGSERLMGGWRVDRPFDWQVLKMKVRAV